MMSIDTKRKPPGQTAKPRKQCDKCPWKTTTNPFDIPNGYCPTKHRALASTIARPGEVRLGAGLPMMACHETKRGKELPCVGWLVQQLGPGNNIGLRLAVATGGIDAKVRTVGPQRETLEETFPDDDDDIEWGDNAEDEEEG